MFVFSLLSSIKSSRELGMDIAVELVFIPQLLFFFIFIIFYFVCSCLISPLGFKAAVGSTAHCST